MQIRQTEEIFRIVEAEKEFDPPDDDVRSSSRRKQTGYEWQHRIKKIPSGMERVPSEHNNWKSGSWRRFLV